MTQPRHFTDGASDVGQGATHWDHDEYGVWRMPTDPSRYITGDDPYWNHILLRAQQVYGDPHIHFEVPLNYGYRQGYLPDQHLVFEDGTRLPEDGTVVYHDSHTKQSFVQNTDGTVSLMGPDGKPGPPMPAAGYRQFDPSHYAAVNEQGQQIGPQTSAVPGNATGYYTDPKTGLLTPKNANGDYFTLGPDGKKSFFDKTGAPITQDQYDKGTHTPGIPPPPPDAGLSTDEQQSGKAADAVNRLHDELQRHFTQLGDAEDGLSAVLLGAHAATAAGQQSLNAIQMKIISAANNPAMSIDTPAGERSFLTFLHSQVGEINDLLNAGSLTADDQAKTAKALAKLYAVDDTGAPNGGSPDPSTPSQQPAPSPSSAPPPPPRILVGTATPTPAHRPMPGWVAEPPMPDSSLSDLLGGGPLGSGMGPDPMSSLASMLPGALGGLGGLGGASPLDGLGGLAGAAAPLAGLASQAGGQLPDHDHEHSSDTADKPDDARDPVKDGKDGKDAKGTADSTQQPGGQPDQQQNSTPPPGGPPAPLAPPPPTSAVKLPDGSTANARTPASAQAVDAYLAGDTISDAYSKNGLQLPPPGTPVTSAVDPSRLACGDVGVFKDHYVVALSSVKAYLNGQVVPLGSVSSSPDFLGWIDPTAPAATPAPPGASAAPAPPPAAPAPNALVDAPPAVTAG